MTPQVLMLILSLADRAVSISNALSTVTAAAKRAQDEGRELTLEEVMEYAAKDDLSRDVLVEAIAEAETTDPEGHTGSHTDVPR